MVVRCGRRWGKTAFASVLVCDGVARGESWGIFAPDYKITAEAYREIFEILSPITLSASKVEGVIRCLGGGRVDFWSLAKERAGRSRKYHGVIVDEAAFVEGGFEFMDSIWKKSIKPTLLDYRGVAWVLSTPSGKDDDNWFYSICHDPESEFVEFHAPTSTNPYLPVEEVEALEKDNPPEVYQQEYLAEFVDWSGVAMFPTEFLLVDGKPVPMPTKTGLIYSTIDTAIKAGQQHNSTAVIWWAYDELLALAPGLMPIKILDWDIVQIEGAAQSGWLPSVNMRGEELAQLCGARYGYSREFIEDKATGSVFIQQANNLRREGGQSPAYGIDGKLTAMGKEERAVAAAPFVFRGDVKITKEAYEKVKRHKKRTANHLLVQTESFRIGSKVKDGLDLLDCFTYGVLVGSLPHQRGLLRKAS